MGKKALSVLLSLAGMFLISNNANAVTKWYITHAQTCQSNFSDTEISVDGNMETFYSDPIIRNIGSQPAMLACKVMLPNGVTITRITIYGFDAGSDAMSFYLKKANYHNSSDNTLGFVSSYNSSGAWSSPTVSSVVNNDFYHYYFIGQIPAAAYNTYGLWNLEVGYQQ